MMVRKRRKKFSIGKSAIIFTSIVMLNFVGVSYAAWTDSLHINSSLTAGEIKPMFVSCNTTDIKIAGNSENTRASFGKVSLLEGKTKEIFLIIKNDGTIPIKADAVEIDRDGLTIEIPAHDIEPMEEKEIIMTVSAPDDIEVVDPNEDIKYHFNSSSDYIKIPYKQFNHQ